MVSRARVLIVVLALIAAFAGFGESAYALGKHAPKPPKMHHAKKNASPYGYLGAKKSTSPYVYLGKKPKKHSR